MEDQELIQQLQQGNLEAFDQAYKKYAPTMLTIAYTFMRDKDDAADVVQDCFATLLNKPQLWKSIRDIRWYLMRMVQNQCLGVIRKRDLQQQKDEVFQYYNKSASEDISLPDPYNNVNPQEKENKVVSWLGSLSPQRKRAMELVYQQELSYQEAALKMGISKQSVKTHLRYAKQILKSKMTIIAIAITSVLVFG
ncbi:RNA polymerase sigma factor [Chitinophaga rhizosphaerae]|uniref:RNA polymerase sigma factor n=1 Tax=Chitinophaga rhizosphaerae TaxID=1864947 RepID=UPI000F801D2E|nr:RNA polymerase sigma factor [Chitinophaga rhizosphaerae]